MKYQIQLMQENKPSDKSGSETTIRQNLEKIDGQMGKYKSNQMIQFERFAGGLIDREQFIMEKKKIAEQISALQAEKEELFRQLQNVEQLAQVEEHDLGRYAFVETLSRELLVALIQEIRIQSDHVIEINWNFR